MRTGYSAAEARNRVELAIRAYHRDYFKNQLSPIKTPGQLSEEISRIMFSSDVEVADRVAELIIEMMRDPYYPEECKNENEELATYCLRIALWFVIDDLSPAYDTDSGVRLIISRWIKIYNAIKNGKDKATFGQWRVLIREDIGSLPTM